MVNNDISDRCLCLLALLEDIFIQDMFMMDQLEEINDKIKNLRVSAKSRTDSSVELGYVSNLFWDEFHFRWL